MGAATDIISTLIDAVATGYGAYTTSEQMGDAQREARNLNNQQLNRQAENDELNRSLALEQLRESKRAQRFSESMQKANLATSRATGAFSMTRAGVQEIEDMLNTNIGLKNIVLNRWKAA